MVVNTKKETLAFLAIREPQHYSMDGCVNGDKVFIKAEDIDEPGSYWVDVLRSDGSRCEDFLVEKDDLYFLNV